MTIDGKDVTLELIDQHPLMSVDVYALRIDGMLDETKVFNVLEGWNTDQVHAVAEVVYWGDGRVVDIEALA